MKQKVHTWQEERTTNNPNPPTMVMWKDKPTRLIDLCKEYGVSRGCIGQRIKTGWDLEEALTTPPTTREATTEKGKAAAVRRQVKDKLFTIFAKHGMKAFEEAVKTKVTDVDAVLPFFKQYIAPHLPKDEDKQQEVKESAKIMINNVIKTDDTEKYEAL